MPGTGAPVNPFAVRHHAPGAIPFLFDASRGAGSAAELWERFEAHGRRGEIVGPHGTGKSTLLRTLQKEAERRGIGAALVRVTDEAFSGSQNFRIARLRNQALLIDGAERLPTPLWWILKIVCRVRRQGLVATTHRRRGLPVLYRTATNGDLAVAVAERVLAASPGVPRLVEPEEARQSLALSDGDLREALFRLYDLYEERWHPVR